MGKIRNIAILTIILLAVKYFGYGQNLNLGVKFNLSLINSHFYVYNYDGIVLGGDQKYDNYILQMGYQPEFCLKLNNKKIGFELSYNKLNFSPQFYIRSVSFSNYEKELINPLKLGFNIISHSFSANTLLKYGNFKKIRIDLGVGIGFCKSYSNPNLILDSFEIIKRSKEISGYKIIIENRILNVKSNNYFFNSIITFGYELSKNIRITANMKINYCFNNLFSFSGKYRYNSLENNTPSFRYSFVYSNYGTIANLGLGINYVIL